MTYHVPVLLDETLRLLAPAQTVLDCTLGGGGHAAALLRAGKQIVALDRDPDAIAHAAQQFAREIGEGKITIHLANFGNVEEVDGLAGRKFDGILLDLGVSSHQFDDVSRGFTFVEGAELDMRMAKSSAGEVSAASILNETSEKVLEGILRNYADEPRARKLASQITRRRQREPFRTSDDLVRAIRGALGPRSGPSDFARIFQAFRIAVNDEAESLARGLPKLREMLKPSGVMVVISYHSGEDRVVKNAFRDWAKGCVCPPRQPICTCGIQPMGEVLTRKAITAADAEISSNTRSRSARLRAWQRKG